MSTATKSNKESQPGLGAAPGILTLEEETRERFRQLKEALGGDNDILKVKALTALGYLARNTYFRPLWDESIREMGDALTGAKGSTAVREAAARAMGVSRIPEALSHLEVVLRASEAEKASKYPTSVRVEAVKAAWEIGRGQIPREGDGGESKSVKARAQDLVTYAAEHDRYTAKTIARELIGQAE